MDTMYANQYLGNVRDQMGQRVYDASKWPIFDIRITKTKNNVIMHFSMEFLIADWMSMQILVSEFETKDDLNTYQNHPEHKAVGATYVRPYVAERRVCDYEF